MILLHQLIFFKNQLVPKIQNFQNSTLIGQNFLLVDLRDFFSDLVSGDEKKKKKSSENDQLTGHFQSVFFFFFF